MPKSEKWLIHMPNNPGDVVMALFVVDAWKTLKPQDEIHFLTDHECLGLVQNHPQIHRAWATPRFELQRIQEADHALEYLTQCADHLAQEAFDGILNLYQGIEGALYLGLIPASKRIGLCLDPSAEAVIYDPATRALFAIPAQRDANPFHCIDHYLAMAGLQVKKRPQAQFPPTQTQPYPGAIALQIGSAWIGKKWPLSSWQNLCVQLLQEFPHCPILLLGSPQEYAENQTLAALDPRIHNLCGHTQLHEIPALLSHCRLLISGDTFAMHVASALRIPQIALFGPSRALETGPYSSAATLLQAPSPICEELPFLNTKILESIPAEDPILLLNGKTTHTPMHQIQWIGYQQLYPTPKTTPTEPCPHKALELHAHLQLYLQNNDYSLVNIIEQLELELAQITHKSYHWEIYRISLRALNWRDLPSYMQARFVLLQKHL